MTRKDYALYAAALFCWGTSWLALRIQAVSVAPELAIFWRFLLATGLMGSIALAKGHSLTFPLSRHRWFLALGLALFSFNFIGTYNGSLTIPSGLVAVVFSLASLFNMGLGFLLNNERSTGRMLLGACIGVLGVVLLFANEWTRVTPWALALGLGWSAFGTLCFSCGNLISARLSREGLAMPAFITWGMVYGTLAMASLILLRGGSFAIPLTPLFLGSLFWVVVFASIAAFLVYLTLVKRLGASRAGYTTILFPIVALLVSTTLETMVPGQSSNYVWTPLSFVGIALALGGNLLVMRR
jgi:drug/metabolite transporter (DMT)-like permease